MKKLYFLSFLASLIFSVPALAGNKDAVNTKGFGNSAAIKGYDPVAYWDADKLPEAEKAEWEAVKGSKELSYEWHGAEWRFSSQENLDKFKADPLKYAPQYGGYCAWAMADGKGRTVGIDPDAWSIYNGKLYLNYNQNVLKEWISTRDEAKDGGAGDIEVANRNYPSITDYLSFEDASESDYQ